VIPAVQRRSKVRGVTMTMKQTHIEVARIGDSEPRLSWAFAGSTEAYPRDDSAQMIKDGD
jgi:hypothetical protein